MADEKKLKQRFSFAIGLRFEIFYALQAVTDTESRIHPAWTKRTRASLPEAFDTAFLALGGSPLIWPILADLLRTSGVELPFGSILAEIRKKPLASVQREILCGALHSAELAERLLARKLSLKQALARVPKQKQEWLSFIGLYPYISGTPMVRAIELIIQHPERFRQAVLTTLELFWKGGFRELWLGLQPQLRSSLEEKQRLFESCSLQEFARHALLRIEVSEKQKLIRAARGGYELPFDEVRAAFVLPSCFNDKRYWTAFEDGGRTTAYFPYFDPSITLTEAEVAGSLAQPELDPALIFKALGDPTRYAIAKLIASSPRSSVELAKALEVSKPTISHHVHLLRDAGLLSENYSTGSVFLSLKRETLERLSALSVRDFFREVRRGR